MTLVQDTKTHLPVEGVLAKRAAVLASGKPFVPSQQESDSIALYVMAQVDLGHRTVVEMSQELGCSERGTWRWLAKGRALTASPADATRYRWTIATLLEQLHGIALENSDVKEARNSLMDMARTLGLVSTGGNAPTVNVGVAVGQFGDDDLRSEMRRWMAANSEVVEAEVIDGVVE